MCTCISQLHLTDIYGTTEDIAFINFAANVYISETEYSSKFSLIKYKQYMLFFMQFTWYNWWWCPNADLRLLTVRLSCTGLFPTPLQIWMDEHIFFYVGSLDYN